MRTLQRVRGITLGSTLAAVLAAPAASAAIRTVGPGCQYDRLDVALAVAGDGDEIRLRTGQLVAVAATLADIGVTITGGYAACDAEAPDGITVLDGAGLPAASILTLRDARPVSIARVHFAHGDEVTIEGGPTRQDGRGGCLEVSGDSAVTLNGVSFTECAAERGGAVSFETTRADASLVFEDEVEVLYSLADSCGGVELAGPLEFRARGTGRIAGNVAQGWPSGFGGGLCGIGGARLDIGTVPSPGSSAYFSGNEARGDFAAGNGAAIWLRADAAGDAPTLALYSPDPNRPMTFADHPRGGSVIDLQSVTSPLVACLWDTAFVDNGMAVVSTLGSGSQAYFNPLDHDADGPCGTRPAASQPCTAGATCNLVSTRPDLDVAGPVFAIGGGTLAIDRMRLQAHGRFAGVLHANQSTLQPTPWAVRLSNVAIVANDFQQAPFLLESAGTFEARHLTLAGNAMPARPVFEVRAGNGSAPTEVGLANSIVDQPQRMLFDDRRRAGELVVQARHVASTDAGALPDDSVGVIALSEWAGVPIEARYVDAAGGDFRLASDSPLIDVAPADDHLREDLDGRPRTRDVATGNVSGPRDLGAYEAGFAPGVLFADGFE